MITTQTSPLHHTNFSTRIGGRKVFRLGSRHLRSPPGTVLSPVLFLSFIYDLPTRITSKLRLFADDCLIYRTIYNPADSVVFQEDLNKLQKWSDILQMQFHTEKCHTTRPHLEYCRTVWNQYTKKEINKIENIQRRALRCDDTVG